MSRLRHILIAGRGLIAAAALFVCIPATAQNGLHLSHRVMVPAAGVTAISGIHLSQTVGETAVLHFSEGNRDLTQGFQQPRLRFRPVEQPPGSGVNVYPNPAMYHLNIRVFSEGARDYIIEIYNMAGILVYNHRLSFTETHFHVHQLEVRNRVKGLHILRVRCHEGKIDRSFRILLI